MTSHHYNQNGQLVRKNRQQIQYDLAGNQTAKGKQHLSYDAYGRLEQISNQKGILAQYQYNALGQSVLAQRYKNNRLKVQRHYHYSLQGQVQGISIYRKNGKLRKHIDIIWLNQTPVIQISQKYNNKGKRKTTEVIYLHTDHLNAPRSASDPQQRTVWQWQSDAFGKGKPDTDPDQNGKKTWVPLRFPGQFKSVAKSPARPSITA